MIPRHMANPAGIIAALPLSAKGRTALRSYAAESARPFAALVFLGPMLAIAELWLLLSAFRFDAGSTAKGIIYSVFGLIGVSASWAPALVFIAVLVIRHWLKGDRGTVRAGTLGGMVIESFVLALPMLAISTILLMAIGGAGTTALNRCALAISAASFEEFLFRLVLVGGGLWFVTEVLKAPSSRATWVVVGTAAVLFSLSHYLPRSGDAISPLSFLFRTAAGVYLGLIYLYRGIGLSAGCHTVYNLVLIAFGR